MIRTEKLTIRYDAAVALRDVTVELPDGCVTAIVGPSGCGKSSFLAALNRMTDEIPGARVSGKVEFDGEDIHAAGTSLRSLRRRVGMIFQKPNPFVLSIRENVELALEDHGIGNRTERAAIVERALRDVGLFEEVKDRLSSSALELSGGQQQRLCIARALALSPDVLLLDEPCSALDPMASAVIEELVVSLRGKVTPIIVTHNLAQARRIADRVAVFWMRDGAGTLIEEGTAHDIFESPREESTAAYVQGARG